LARYRLRFLLQEFDLPYGETLIGRSPECSITIEDPLVSRRHARVLLETEHAIFEDLGSRNGSRVNGVITREPHSLKDGDRLRIGTQELVFCEVPVMPIAANKPTGFLRHCAKCQLPYPEEMGACPNCGATERMDEDTLSGMLGDTRQSWTLQLLVEVLEKALSLGRESDADRILKRAVASLDERLMFGNAVDQKQLDAISDCALRLAEMQKKAALAQWVVDVYRRARLIPSAGVADRLGRLPTHELSSLSEPIEEILKQAGVRAGSMTHDEMEGIRRLEALRSQLRGG
jgi:hypothetical protein